MSDQSTTVSEEKLESAFSGILTDINELNDAYIGQAHRSSELVSTIGDTFEETTNISSVYSSNDLYGINLSRRGSPYKIETGDELNYYRVTYTYNLIGTYAENVDVGNNVDDLIAKLKENRDVEYPKVRSKIVSELSGTSCELITSWSDDSELIQVEVSKKLFYGYSVTELDQSIQTVLNTGYSVANIISNAYNVDIKPQEIKNVMY